MLDEPNTLNIGPGLSMPGVIFIGRQTPESGGNGVYLAKQAVLNFLTTTKKTQKVKVDGAEECVWLEQQPYGGQRCTGSSCFTLAIGQNLMCDPSINKR